MWVKSTPPTLIINKENGSSIGLTNVIIKEQYHFNF